MSILSTNSQQEKRHVAFEGTEDLLLDFFCVRFATSNAKLMATYLQFVFGFKEIAYKGLETGAIFKACHVLRCNDIIFEVVSPLYCIEPLEDIYDIPSSDSSEWEEEVLGETNWNSRMAHDPWFARMLEIPKFKAFMSDSHRTGTELQSMLNEILDVVAISRFVTRHGCGVIDVAFRVVDVEKVFQRAISNGAIALQEPIVEMDEKGSVWTAVLGSPNTDLRHTIVQKINYQGIYLPNYGNPLETGEIGSQIGSEYDLKRPPAYNTLSNIQSNLLRVDHCVQNFSWNEMKKNATFYSACFGMSKFWSVDEKDVSTGKTGLNSTVMMSKNGLVKMPINEPVKVKLRGQIEEFYDFHGGPGVQHIALQTEDIVQAVEFLWSRGMTFNSIQDEYYLELKQRLESCKIRLFEDFDMLRSLNILVDFDPNSRYLYRDEFYTCHYILQIFTKPIQDRPTFFFEIIQRRNHNGFGKGTFKGLFETIEREQMLRGTL